MEEYRRYRSYIGRLDGNGKLRLDFDRGLIMADKFSAYQSPLNGPANSAFAVTKSDSTVFSQPTRGLWVGGTGDVAVRMLDQTTVTFTAVPSGVMLNIRVDKVLSTGTSAT